MPPWGGSQPMAPPLLLFATHLPDERLPPPDGGTHDGGAERERQLRARAEQIRMAQREQQEATRRAESLRLSMTGDVDEAAAEEGQALSSLRPRQRERLKLAVDFIMPHGESVGIVEALGRLANGEQEHAVRMFAALAGRELTVDIGVRFTGGFSSALTAVMALENLGAAIAEAELSGSIEVPRGQPATWQEAQMRVATLQLELATLRSGQSTHRDRAHHTGSHSDGLRDGHAPPPPSRPPVGAVDTVPFTNSLDSDTTSRACHRDVIAPACALPFEFRPRTVGRARRLRGSVATRGGSTAGEHTGEGRAGRMGLVKLVR
jgi:hypothetical protein